MNKTELVTTVAEKAGISKKDAEKAVNATMGAITEAMQNGEPVSLIGFGSFAVQTRGAREGKNPKTGEKISIAPSKVVRFKAGRS